MCDIYQQRAQALREDDSEQRDKLWTEMPLSCRAPVCNTVANDNTRAAHSLCCTPPDTTIPESMCDAWSPCAQFVTRGQRLTIDDNDAIDALWRDMGPSCHAQVCEAIANDNTSMAFSLCCKPPDPTIAASTCDAWSPCEAFVTRGQRLAVDDTDAIDALWQDMEPSCRLAACNTLGATNPQTAFNLCCLAADSPFDEPTCRTWAEDGLAKDDHATAITVGKYFLGFGSVWATHKWAIHRLDQKAYARKEADAASHGMTVAEYDEEMARMEAAVSRNSRNITPVDDTFHAQFSDEFPDFGRTSFDDDMADLTANVPVAQPDTAAPQRADTDTFANPLAVEGGANTDTIANPLAVEGAGPDLSLVISGDVPEWDDLDAGARADAVELGYSSTEWNTAATPEAARDGVVRQIQADAIRRAIPDEQSRARFDLLVDAYPSFSPREVEEALQGTGFHAGQARNRLNNSTPSPRRRSWLDTNRPDTPRPSTPRPTDIVYKPKPNLFPSRGSPRPTPSPRTPRPVNNELLPNRKGTRAWLEQFVDISGTTAHNELLGRPVPGEHRFVPKRNVSFLR